MTANHLNRLMIMVFLCVTLLVVMAGNTRDVVDRHDDTISAHSAYVDLSTGDIEDSCDKQITLWAPAFSPVRPIIPAYTSVFAEKRSHSPEMFEGCSLSARASPA
jgi:hypothetical protein